MTQEQYHPTCGNAKGLGEIQIFKRTRDTDGSCSFCTIDWPTRIVHVLEGNRLQIRLCNKCLKKIQDYKP